MNPSLSNSATASETREFGFWGNLPLSRKLMAAFGVVFVAALVIAAVTLWGLNRTSEAYEYANQQGFELRRISDQLTIDLLQARRAEKNFLLRWQSEGFDTAYANYITTEEEDARSTRGPAYIQNINALHEDLAQLAPFGAAAATVSTGDMTQAQYEADIAALMANVDLYDQSFTALVEALRRKGYDENTGYQGEFRTSAALIEAKISGQAGLEQLQLTYLELRRNEKDYLARGDQEYVDAVRALASELRSQVEAADVLEPAAKRELYAALDAYLESFDASVELDKEIAERNAAMIAAGRAVEPLAAKIEVLGEQVALDHIQAAQADSVQTFVASIVTVFIALSLSVFLSIYLSRQVTRPIINLTNTAGQIAGGKFDAIASVTSGDEVGMLAQTFNTMTARLRQAFEDVRRRALAVQTSAEVSRRLSAATSPRQLAVDVVEQIQAAFGYYHAHIYFLDETSGDLIMTGGTGEVGATLLARGHRVPKGRGLVGRAADTNAPVLVKDVSKAEGWLPNPLLPDTKSETAIPIASGKQVLGVLDVQQNIVNGLGEDDVEMLQSIAGQVAISYLNARSFEESRTKAEVETWVNTIGQKIQRTTSMEETLQTAIRELGLVLGARRVKVSVGGSSRQNGDEGSSPN